MKELEIYSDINGTSPETQDKVINIDSIYQSIYNILNTRRGERAHLPEFGCDLEDIPFEPLDDDTAFLIFEIITEAISRWEPRVYLNTGLSSVEPDEDNNAYDVTLVFSIAGLEETYSYSGLLGV